MRITQAAINLGIIAAIMPGRTAALGGSAGREGHFIGPCALLLEPRDVARMIANERLSITWHILLFNKKKKKKNRKERKTKSKKEKGER
jgi:hypothetical protein